jgi:hypothetical protein
MTLNAALGTGKANCRTRAPGHREEPKMSALPPAVNLLIVGDDWLPPLYFRPQSYLEFCQAFDAALRELETRFPSHRPLLTLEGRNKKLRRKPK